MVVIQFMANQATPPATYPPLRNKALIAGLTKGNHWFISPDHKALLISGGGYVGGSWLTGHVIQAKLRSHGLNLGFL